MNKELLFEIKKGLDFENILKKAAENNGWNLKQSEYAYEWYLKHLYLCIHHPTSPIAAISKSADDLWHQHILDTRKYATDCNQIAGRFLNHTPIYGKPTNFELEAYYNTIKLYEEIFEERPKDEGQTSGNYSYHNPNIEI